MFAGIVVVKIAQEKATFRGDEECGGKEDQQCIEHAREKNTKKKGKESEKIETIKNIKNS